MTEPRLGSFTLNFETDRHESLHPGRSLRNARFRTGQGQCESPCSRPGFLGSAIGSMESSAIAYANGQSLSQFAVGTIDTKLKRYIRVRHLTGIVPNNPGQPHRLARSTNPASSIKKTVQSLGRFSTILVYGRQVPLALVQPAKTKVITLRRENYPRFAIRMVVGSVKFNQTTLVRLACSQDLVLGGKD